ncbi:unnamed protein product [Pedinophyceae sp. YPF-701]|nr:unnamed protein product [Pedinophyceae sp. YPF-701]
MLAFRSRGLESLRNSTESAFAVSPMGSQGGPESPRRPPRKVPRVAFKILDAPGLMDDFYLNLIDWSFQDVIAVALSAQVYLWSAVTGKVERLCELSRGHVCSVAWSKRGSYLAIGASDGSIQVWDVEARSRRTTVTGHSARAGTLAWHGHTLASGSRDRTICMYDVRASTPITSRLTAHTSEVCGLAFADEDGRLASGGNDNMVYVWDQARPEAPQLRLGDHTAAVKAIVWSPHQQGLLASGGGTADKTIKFWSTSTGTCVNSINTGSQVCNLVWSRTCKEIVSTHGYSENNIVVWRYPSMSQVVTLPGHDQRVLYLAMSPDGETIVTGAGDETLRFWNVFPPRKTGLPGSEGHLSLSGRSSLR